MTLSVKALALSLATLLSASSFAQQNVTLKEEVKQADEKVLGWNKSANLGLNLSFSSSENVVGQTDGNSETYGANLKSTFNYVTEESEWRNTATLTESTTKTPAVPRYVKSNDLFKLETLYLYSIPKYPTIGPYARGEVSTAIFKGEDIQAADRPYIIQNSAGAPISAPFTASTVRLTDSFKPLTTKESAGFFWKAAEEDNFKALLRVGLGAVQVDASGQYALAGTDGAGNHIVKELEDINQLGLEAGASVKGKVDEKSSYEAGFDLLTPFVNNKRAGDDRDAIRLTNIDGFAKLTSNITSWASFGYDYKLKLQPQLVDRVQSIHMLVISANYNLF